MIFAVILMLACYLVLMVVARRCADGRIGVNSLVGIRTTTTMSSPATWTAAHRAAERPTVIGAYIAIACALPAFLLPAEVPQAVALGLSTASMLAGVIYGAIAGDKAARAVLSP
ncbi:SdpI family protein [Paeniglutamicibacter cryotolerans]|uniref:SdpI family protein n=1 Tax=Paeniglutamicibacter cryotolerans TaxID=670079 RepID=A0A839QD71_9MICC|nr:SdpI family protein [Paeniglutamicibacter cryotolerans]MBB2994108.1 hypothetical protein [Paeniglutamicibacter cryotolerans]